MSVLAGPDGKGRDAEGKAAVEHISVVTVPERLSMLVFAPISF